MLQGSALTISAPLPSHFVPFFLLPPNFLHPLTESLNLADAHGRGLLNPSLLTIPSVPTTANFHEINDGTQAVSKVRRAGVEHSENTYCGMLWTK